MSATPANAATIIHGGTMPVVAITASARAKMGTIQNEFRCGFWGSDFKVRIAPSLV